MELALSFENTSLIRLENLSDEFVKNETILVLPNLPLVVSAEKAAKSFW